METTFWRGGTVELTLIKWPRTTQTEYTWNFSVKTRCRARRIILHEFHSMLDVALTSWDPRFTRFLRARDDDSQIMVVLFSNVLGDPSLTSHSVVTPFLPKESSSVSTNNVSNSCFTPSPSHSGTNFHCLPYGLCLTSSSLDARVR